MERFEVRVNAARVTAQTVTLGVHDTVRDNVYAGIKETLHWVGAHGAADTAAFVGSCQLGVVIVTLIGLEGAAHYVKEGYKLAKEFEGRRKRCVWLWMCDAALADVRRLLSLEDETERHRVDLS